jgi:PAS domain S-box-containing protein
MSSRDTHFLEKAAQRTPVSIVISDARVEDNPITFVNKAFQNLTLYSREFAVGRNCRFLQGEHTDPDDVAAIRKGLETGREFQVTITNHKADGTPFRNQLLISPVFGDDDEVVAYFAVQRELPADEDAAGDDPLDLMRELQHRVKNHLSMVVSLIRMQASRRVTPESMRAVGRRVEALALLYDELFTTTLGDGPGEAVRAGAYLSRIANVIAGLEGRSSVRVNVNCEDVDLPVDQAARLGLLLSELLTNSLEHAFEGRETGFVTVTFKKISGGGVRLTVEDDGVGLPDGSDWPYRSPSVADQSERTRSEGGELDTTGQGGRSGVGGTIVVALTETLGARLDVNRALRGTIVTVDFAAKA